MVAFGLVTSVGLILAGFMIASAALCFVSAMSVRGRTPSGGGRGGATFLFDGDALVDLSDSAQAVLAGAPLRGSDLARVVAGLGANYPGLDALLGTDGDVTRRLAAQDGSGGSLDVARRGKRLRLELDLGARALNFEPDPQTLAAMTEELDLLRGVAQNTRVPVWRQRRDGVIVWANATYLDLAERFSDSTGGALWPPRALFDAAAMAEIETAPSRRMRLDTGEDEAGHWFDCHAAEVGEDLLVTAIPADSVVRAEDKLRGYMQTLSGTFAHLSVGLAIFDRNRELTLFNPALTDLLPLPVSFLSARPALFSFLDQLRELQLMPEPKDYKSWRQQMSALEAAAADGSYAETWSLPGGQTYRVTGRPHSDGGVAFLFEDISAEIALTRRFRAELETGQAVLDTFDEAVAVFTAGGVLTLSNRAYRELWSCDPDCGLGEITLTEATRRWHEMCEPTPVWGDVRDFAATLGERANWTAEATLLDGRTLECRFEPLPGGATLAAFAPSPERVIDRAAAPMAVLRA